MSITIFPVTPNFVAEIGDVNLARLSEPELAEVKEAFWKYAVLIFPDQHLTGDQHLAFARDQIDLAVAIARIARDDAATRGHQVPSGGLFGLVSGALLWRSRRWQRRCRHQRATSSRSIVPLR